MLQIEYHLLPAVKRSVAVLGKLTRYSLAACAGLAVAELVLLPLRLPLTGIFCGMVSSFLQGWSLMLLALLAAWCHSVLLAGQGSSITRWLLEHGANANAVTDKGATPLQCVGSDNRAAIIQALKAHGAQ